MIESDRDGALYDKTGPVDVSMCSLLFNSDAADHPIRTQWRRNAATPLASLPPGLSLSFPSTSSTKLRIAVYVDHRPERLALQPEVGQLLDVGEADRATVLQALWSYIKLHKLQDPDKKHIKPDAPLKRLLQGVDKVPFHHLPEYVNRFLMPAAPVLLDLHVNLDEGAPETSHTAFDLEISVPDPLRAEMEQVSVALNAPSEALAQVVTIDEQVSSRRGVRLHSLPLIAVNVHAVIDCE